VLLKYHSEQNVIACIINLQKGVKETRQKTKPDILSAIPWSFHIKHIPDTGFQHHWVYDSLCHGNADLSTEQVNGLWREASST